jgi:cytochrome c peroxidase
MSLGAGDRSPSRNPGHKWWLAGSLGLALISALASATAPGPLLPPGVAPPVVPADNPMTAAKVELGRRLFYDADLSADGTMSCGTCHEQHRAFAEGNAAHPGINGERGRRNVPGLANVAWLAPLTFADRGLTTLEAQVSVPVLGTHPVEMGMTGREPELATRLGRDDCYRRMFAKAFPETRGRIDLANTAKAIAAFERTLTSYGSPYDLGTLPPEARQGSAVFARDCASCHAGPNFTDLAYHKLGDASDDQGLSEKTGLSGDAGKFRTPSLRNVTLTGPWWHDGSARSIGEVIARHGLSESEQDQAGLFAFLGALGDTEFTTRPSLSLPGRACGKRL